MDVKERWKRVQGFTGKTVSHYEVSDLGRLRRVLFNPKRNPRICGTSLDKDGYVRTPIRNMGKLYMKRRCRLVLEAFVGPCPEGHQCMHKNSIRDDDRLINLQWGTPTMNQRQRFSDGTHNRGERHGRTKLTNEMAQKMIDEYHSSRITQEDLGKKYGLSQTPVGYLISGKTWKNLRRPVV